MNIPMDSYRVSAAHYDAAYARKEDLLDLPFYVELARQSGGPVLEIGCGTGRVLLPVARAGVAIHGVDNSEPMLDVLRGKLAQEPPEVQQRVTLGTGDMRTFCLEQKFPLVTIPFRPLQHMYTVEDQAAALRTAQFHVSTKGRLVFDVFFPRFEMIPAGVGEEVLEMKWQHPSDANKKMRRYFRKEGFDKINQNFGATFLYRTYEGGKLLREEAEPLKMSYYTYPHLRALFLLAGLEVVEEYGSFAKTPLDNDAKEMIFVLKRSG